MGYDGDFYEAYEQYLYEPVVRAAHDQMFKIFQEVDARLNGKSQAHVIDFGCGRSTEYFRFGSEGVVPNYTGIDLHADERFGFPFKHITAVAADYRKIADLNSFLQDSTKNPYETSKPTSFVSLFSSEIMTPYQENYKFYETIFSQLPQVTCGLVSGFYYTDKMDENPIGESGGLESYQTLEKLSDVRSDTFSETRIELEVPSEFFGSNVVEVWKIFERRDRP